MKAPLGIAGIAARRLATRPRVGTNERVKEAQLAMREALARLDWREARRLAEALHAMGFGRKGPMSSTDAKAFPVHPRLPR